MAKFKAFLSDGKTMTIKSDSKKEAEYFLSKVFLEGEVIKVEQVISRVEFYDSEGLLAGFKEYSENEAYSLEEIQETVDNSKIFTEYKIFFI